MCIIVRLPAVPRRCGISGGAPSLRCSPYCPARTADNRREQGSESAMNTLDTLTPVAARRRARLVRATPSRCTCVSSRVRVRASRYSRAVIRSQGAVFARRSRFARSASASESSAPFRCTPGHREDRGSHARRRASRNSTTCAICAARSQDQGEARERRALSPTSPRAHDEHDAGSSGTLHLEPTTRCRLVPPPSYFAPPLRRPSCATVLRLGPGRRTQRSPSPSVGP